MPTHRSGSYIYNAICDVCGGQFKSDKLMQRWDGYMVCKQDWEPRNILDFYRPRDDNHKLPWTRLDSNELTYTPIFTNLTASIDTKTGTYQVGNTLNFKVQITMTAASPTSSTLGAEVSLPFQAVVDGTIRVFDSAGVFLGTGSIISGNLTGSLPDWVTTNNIIITGSYGV